MSFPRLDTAMRMNAAFSGLSGMVAVGLAVGMPQPLGIHRWFLAAIGVGLAGYGVQLLLWARTERLVVPGARLATAGDALWVVGSVIVLLGLPDALSPAGRLALGLTSLVVADFAIVQFIGLRRRGRQPVSI